MRKFTRALFKNLGWLSIFLCFLPVASSQVGFIRSGQIIAGELSATTQAQPNIPHYETVPDAWKPPFGPYRQSPEGAPFAGHWFYVSPFTGPDPWNRMNPPEAEELPDGFEPIFGERPIRDRVALVLWEQDLKYFKRAGTPEGYELDELQLAQGVLDFWDMGTAHHYEGRYGWMTRFPQSADPRYETPAYTAIKYTHFAVSGFQISLLHQGVRPSVRHPFVPEFLFDSVPESVE